MPPASLPAEAAISPGPNAANNTKRGTGLRPGHDWKRVVKRPRDGITNTCGSIEEVQIRDFGARQYRNIECLLNE